MKVIVASIFIEIAIVKVQLHPAMHWLQSAGGLEGGWLNRVHTHTYTCHVFYPWTVVLNVEGSDGDTMVSWHSTVWYIDCLRHVHLRDQSLTRSEEIGRVFFFIQS